MKIAYLILAHDNPIHFKRLIQALNTDSSWFFVHIDRKSQLFQFHIPNMENVYYIKNRIPIYWGDFSIVEATLSLLRKTFTDSIKFDYFVLISGTDFPIQPASYIKYFFEKNSGKEFMNILKMPCGKLNKPVNRLTTFNLRPGDSKILKIIQRVITRTGDFICHRNFKNYLNRLVPYAGSGWWALSHKAVAHIIKFVDEEKKIVKFFKNTMIPDESFFHTILGNSEFKNRIQRNLTYTNWKINSNSPASITKEDLKFLRSNKYFNVEDIGRYGKGELLFARKFLDSSEMIVNEVERINKSKTIDCC